MSIFDDLKSIGKVLQEAGKIEQYKQILETQKELLEMQKKLQDLEKENRELKEKLEIKENLKYDRENNVYWLEKEGKGKEGPFCPLCWETESKLIHLNSTGRPNVWVCFQCKNYFGSGENHPQSPSAGGRSIFDEYI